MILTQHDAPLDTDGPRDCANAMDISLDLRVLYPGRGDRRAFIERYSAFLATLGAAGRVFLIDGGLLRYTTSSLWAESCRPSKQPIAEVVLVFGNPTPNSVARGVMFSNEASGVLHRVWRALERAGVFPAVVGERRDAAVYNMLVRQGRTNPRLALTSFYTLPTPTSDAAWAGVAGIRRLLRGHAFTIYEQAECIRFYERMNSLLSKGGQVLVFQQNAYKALVAFTSARPTDAVEHGGRSGIEFHQLPPTRHIFSKTSTDALCRQLRGS